MQYIQSYGGEKMQSAQLIFSLQLYSMAAAQLAGNEKNY